VITESCTFFVGRELLEDDPPPGQPVSAWTNENVDKACTTVMQDRQITTRLLTEHLGVGKEVARQILERDLQRREIFSRFVPYSEAVSCFQIDLCDPSSPLLPRFGTSIFSFPKGKTGTKRKEFQRN
jgi:hypothetical protein